MVGFLAMWLAGCVTGGATGDMQAGLQGQSQAQLQAQPQSQQPQAQLQARPRTGAKVAFESIDGPPPEVFEALVATLNEEAAAGKVPVTSREDHAAYRIRAYVAVLVLEKEKETVLSWVWDIYEGETRRAARLSGEEKAGPAAGGAGSAKDALDAKDAWDAASAAVLKRMAKSGMEQLAAFLARPETVAPASPASDGAGEESGAVVADMPPVRREPMTVAAAL